MVDEFENYCELVNDAEYLFVPLGRFCGEKFQLQKMQKSWHNRCKNFPSKDAQSKSKKCEFFISKDASIVL